MPARRLTNGKKKSKFIRNTAGHLLAERSRLFLPDHLDQVRAIAMRGIKEDQMCEIFDIGSRQMGLWKSQYPLFKEALEAGYTDADAAVLGALYQSAIGYTHDEEKIFSVGRRDCPCRDSQTLQARHCSDQVMDDQPAAGPARRENPTWYWDLVGSSQ